MRFDTTRRWLGVASLLVLAGCGDLDVENPNAPDRQRALSDPAALEAAVGGSMRNWLVGYTQLRSSGVLAAQARSYSSSWNNGNLNFYSSVDNASAPPEQWVRNNRAWQNNPSAAGRTSVEAFWSGGNDETGRRRAGLYSALASANAVLTAIRKDDIEINNESDTRRAETVAQLMQGAALMMLSLQYDKAYIVDENSDLTTLQYSPRDEVRDSAVSKLEQAAALADANEFTTPSNWTGPTGGGFAYSSDDIARIARTMAAMALAYYPRDNSEVATVDWNKVIDLAEGGMSAGSTPVNFRFEQDGGTAWLSEQMNWFDGIDGGRMSTRVAHLMDPVTQRDPWPDGGNPQPNSPDRRMGDGTFGDAGTQANFGTVPATANGGSDYAWSARGAIMRPDRGSYHQSNIAQVRYDESRTMDGDGQYAGFGPAPAINATVNDLIWAEALMRSGGSLALAAQLIDRSRVGRGGLPTSAGRPLGTEADGPCMATGVLAKDGAACTLWSMLQYENEVELPGLGPAVFWYARKTPVIIGGGWNTSPRRIIAGLIPGTPREMPVPHIELGVKGEPLYTFGGSTPNSTTP